MKNLTPIWVGILLMLSITVNAQNPQKIYHWMQQLGGPGWDIPTSITTDSKNNVYVAGSFTERLQCNKKEIKSEGNHDIYVARFTQDGRLQWLWQAGGLYMDNISAIYPAPDNDLYITGIIQGEMKFGKQKIQGESKKLFVARINKRGKADWVHTIPFYYAASGYLMDADIQGNVIVGGVFSDTLHCATGDLISKGHNDMFVARIMPDGTVDNIVQLGGEGKEKLSALSVDSLNHIYIAGKNEKAFQAGYLEITASSKQQKSNSFIMQLDSMLMGIWSKPFNSPSYVDITGMACDKQNQLLLSGSFNQELLVDTLQFDSKGLTDFFVCKADSTGNINWLKTFGGKYSDRCRDLKLNMFGGAMVTGSFNDTLQMDSIQINTVSEYSEAFIAQLDTSGMVIWAEAMHGKGGSASNGGALDTKGNLYLMGSFNGSLSAGGSEIETLGDEDIFVAKYYNCPPVASAINSPGYLCQGSIAELSIGKGYMNIIWNDTLQNVESIHIDAPGDYYVTMVDKRGCVISDTVTITEVPTLEFSLGRDTAMLISEKLELIGPDNAFAYLWNDNTNLQTQIAYSNNHAGIYGYKLTITDSLGCQWSDSIRIEFYEELDYADLTEGERLVTIYPIPVKESFTWRFETTEEVKMTVEIVDGAGIIHYHQKIDRYLPGEQKKVEARNLNPGIYFFTIISNGKRLTKKFVKN
ncbi:T9SS type A sorting domain-containing protein [Saccharicrinis fermentans]|nr:T9SS type A sorting domain-containing protein [Saccharicrinis fermentans]